MVTLDINKGREVINQYSQDKKVYSTKFVDSIPNDIDKFFYKYINGELIRDRAIDFKSEKLKELETYIQQVKETGVEYDGKWFKCDDECKNNITQSMLFIDSLLPLTWFTRNGEQGTVTFTTKEEFMAFVQVIAGKLAEIQNSYYAYKYSIEQAQTEEELNAIVFGGDSNDTQEE